MEKLAVRSAQSAPAEPAFGASLSRDAEAASRYFTDLEAFLQSSRADNRRAETAALKARAHAVKEQFFRHHAAAIYDEMTGHGARTLRVSELLAAASGRYPALLPTRVQIDAERALLQQSAKQGRELDQGLFIAQILADQRCGMHLIHAMLKPKREALDRLAEFRRSGFADLGEAKIERKGKVGHVTLTNPKFLNAEDDRATAALETAIDLVLLDDAIEVGVLRGGIVQHPKYAGRRVFNAGINLTHLYYGQISFVDFIIERELGLLHKIYRGHWRAESYDEQFEDYVEKPWVAAVEAFAIGGGCQLLCVMDRVLAEQGSYFNLPASKEGFIPGAANLRLPRLVGIKLAREGIFFERVFHADTAEGRMICDEVVAAGEMDAAIERNALQLVRAGMTSAVSNRKALRVAEEPLAVFRRYMATYSRQQSLCLYDPKLIENLEQSWNPGRRRM
ncbi:MAG TPA: enoyl-CoA hydratase/isomerase family protein [Xanthobacteraceae bacterium]|nr:enoyl-CoA hydratase/isomerase family protein [Xanthobacteraceae bacterium]